ncbi:hypothetical protein F504_1718 [Ralstonia pseudosolanacearum FQY_4]|nr:hypothetical protein F504_1718 [Ralstonia pseudosolanacearum FQY_4]
MRRDCTLGPSLANPLERLSVALPHHTKRRRATRLPWHLFAA